MGVFLLTRASQPGAAAAGHTAELTPLDSKAHTACIDGDDAATSPSAAATAGPGDDRRWQLSAVRSAQSGGQLLVGVCLQQGTSCTWHAMGACADMLSECFSRAPNPVADNSGRHCNAVLVVLLLLQCQARKSWQAFCVVPRSCSQDSSSTRELLKMMRCQKRRNTSGRCLPAPLGATTAAATWAAHCSTSSSGSGRCQRRISVQQRLLLALSRAASQRGPGSRGETTAATRLPASMASEEIMDLRRRVYKWDSCAALL